MGTAVLRSIKLHVWLTVQLSTTCSEQLALVTNTAMLPGVLSVAGIKLSSYRKLREKNTEIKGQG